MDRITLTFSAQEMAILNKALFLAPYGEVAPIVNSINTQIQRAFDARQVHDEPSGATNQSDQAV